MHDNDPRPIFEVFKEIGIIEQLTRARLEARLPDGLIAPHFAVLNHLINRGDGAVPIDMARAFQVPKTSMTHTLKGLAAKGYVALKENPQDGRSKTVWLTDKGRSLQSQMIAQMAATSSDLFKAVPPEEIAAVLPVLIRLRQHLDSARDAP
ncbi:MarR family transcriptional regulator [Sulfitobacter noctilucicola]|uniref:MarR family winged helix-turn-helix transcriptional regulator n=1 Tax=Sulfitobacter noctilucicola TaxID=1342301 RepID=UPI0004684D15|nr:MarR family transcriptional regulator [Sulfitobacter noctilucicola]KIN63731.1 MarR family transcriptional regulator [Sulfitobacter noctilucicola]